MPLSTNRVRAAVATTLFVIVACDTGTGPAARRPPLSAADSALVAGLVGDYLYADTLALTWRTATAGPDRVLRQRGGAAALRQTAGVMLQARPSGVDSSWTTPSATPTGVRVDTLPRLLWLEGDSLRALGWDVVALPRTAVSDSGLHWTTSIVSDPSCVQQRALFVPEGATDVTCRIAIHWHRRTAAGASHLTWR